MEHDASTARILEVIKSLTKQTELVYSLISDYWEMQPESWKNNPEGNDYGFAREEIEAALDALKEADRLLC